MSPKRKNNFGIIEEIDDDLVYLDIPRIQDSIINVINSSNEPNKLELIMALRMINRNFYRNLLLDDFSKIELYIDNSPIPSWDTLAPQLTTITQIGNMTDMSMMEKHDWAIRDTFLQYMYYNAAEDTNTIERILEHFNEEPSILPYNRVLMNYHMIKQKTVKNIYNFFINNFSEEQLRIPWL
jgi:hypothetical protein